MLKKKGTILSKSERRKNEILVTSLRLFVNEGFDAVTLDDIAVSCNCSHGLIYHYFKDKKDILHNIFESHKSILDGIFNYKIDEKTNILDHIQDEVNYIYKTINNDVDNAYFIYLFFTLPASYKALREKFDKSKYQMAIDKVIEAQHAGVLVKGDPFSLLLLYFSMVIGLTEVKIKTQFLSKGNLDTETIRRLFENKEKK
jgi:AcrR family transcriptional regulator